MNSETINLIRELRRKAPKDFALILASHPTQYSVNYQIGACRSTATPPVYREADPHWEFSLDWTKPVPITVRHPDGSHTQVNDSKPLQSIRDFACFIADTLVADRIPDTYQTV